MSSETSESSRGESVRRVQLELRRAVRNVQGVSGAVGSRLELLPVDLGVLDLIDTTGAQSPGEIASKMGLHAATLTGILDRLEEAGWVKRVADPTDRRRVRIEPDPQRRGDLARMYAPMTRSLASLCGGYSAEELALIIEFLGRVADAGTEAASTVKDDG